ncbi:MAG: hypothetical protein KHZ77_02325 [Veillonella sp.]|uniref:hypothetical protein n=1 Tax=Veillonella sp. TaxID=1926307 RepID=UPI0025D11A90|nr:hypothetical protein [Veillonella sp.]MBS4912983.1 hypothetical protein [Veillonella sp.]
MINSIISSLIRKDYNLNNIFKLFEIESRIRELGRKDTLSLSEKDELAKLIRERETLRMRRWM